LNILAVRTGHVGSFQALFSFHNVELNGLAISHTSKIFLGIVLCDGRLMYEDVFFGIVAVDESVTALHVEPLDCASDFGCDNFLLGLCASILRFVILHLSIRHGNG